MPTLLAAQGIVKASYTLFLFFGNRGKIMNKAANTHNAKAIGLVNKTVILPLKLIYVFTIS